MSIPSALRRALEDGDAVEVARVYDAAYPKLPRLAGKDEAEVVMHQARTAAESMRIEKRLYSHAWLVERGLRSKLPDDLKPPGEKVKPVIFSAVGVAVKSLSSRADRVEEAREIERVMVRAAGQMVRDGITDRARIAPVMWQARENFIRGRLKKMI